MHMYHIPFRQKLGQQQLEVSNDDGSCGSSLRPSLFKLEERRALIIQIPCPGSREWKDGPLKSLNFFFAALLKTEWVLIYVGLKDGG